MYLFQMTPTKEIIYILIKRDGTFKDELTDWMQHVSFSSMGADIADINNDGYPDLFTTDMLPVNDYRLKTTWRLLIILILFNAKLKAGFYYQYHCKTVCN